ncbi:hypothetical protein Tco_1224927 [Tanacetum coccineum]
MDLKTKLEKTTKNHQASIQNLEENFDRFTDKQSGRPSGSLPSSTQPKPKGSSSKPYQPPQARNEHVNVVLTWSGQSYDPPSNPNHQHIDFENPINFDRMRNYGKFLKELVSNKNNLEQISSTFLSDESSAMIQNKVPPKLRDPGTENMLVEVGKFTFPVDFVILEMEEDNKVPLILRRPFLHTTDANLWDYSWTISPSLETLSSLNNLDKMLQLCKDANLVINWEKCHFMVKEGVVLGHKVSSACLEVDKAKINVIFKLPPLTNVKGIRSFLGHAGFY